MLFWASIFISLTPASFEPYATYTLTTEQLTPLASFLPCLWTACAALLQPLGHFIQTSTFTQNVPAPSQDHPWCFLLPPRDTCCEPAPSCLGNGSLVGEGSLRSPTSFISQNKLFASIGNRPNGALSKVPPNTVLPTKGYRLGPDGGVKRHVPHQSILRSPSLHFIEVFPWTPLKGCWVVFLPWGLSAYSRVM